MLSHLEDDVLRAILAVKSDDMNFTPKDNVTANTVLFLMISSPHFKGFFDGAEFFVHDDNSGFCWVNLPEWAEPESHEDLVIRNEVRINALAHRYDYPYCDDDDGEVWDKPLTIPRSIGLMDIEMSRDVIKTIAQLKKDVYYRMLFDESLDLTSSEIQYTVVSTEANIDKLLGRRQASLIRTVFGHRYHNGLENLHAIIAHNPLGPIGILGLFDHAGEGVSDQDKHCFSVSYVSVSPAYRQRGIATQLMREAIKYSISQERYITRTEPSDIGKRLTFDHFSLLVQREFPNFPFISNPNAYQVRWASRQPQVESMDYEEKCKILQHVDFRLTLMKADPSINSYDFYAKELGDCSPPQAARFYADNAKITDQLLAGISKTSKKQSIIRETGSELKM